MSLLGFSFQNETLILDDLLNLYNVNAVRHLNLYESSLSYLLGVKISDLVPLMVSRTKCLGTENVFQ